MDVIKLNLTSRQERQAIHIVKAAFEIEGDLEITGSSIIDETDEGQEQRIQFCDDDGNLYDIDFTIPWDGRRALR